MSSQFPKFRWEKLSWSKCQHVQETPSVITMHLKQFNFRAAVSDLNPFLTWVSPLLSSCWELLELYAACEKSLFLHCIWVEKKFYLLIILHKRCSNWSSVKDNAVNCCALCSKDWNKICIGFKGSLLTFEIVAWMSFFKL